MLTVTPHQLRHTWATELANAGMSLQALMALLGHVTPQMTLRYATLASPTLRTAYDEAMGKMRRQFTLTPVGKPILPDKVGWLHSEMLKTRVAHGYCQRIHIIFTVAAASVVVTACGGTDTGAADKTQWGCCVDGSNSKAATRGGERWTCHCRNRIEPMCGVGNKGPRPTSTVSESMDPAFAEIASAHAPHQSPERGEATRQSHRRDHGLLRRLLAWKSIHLMNHAARLPHSTCYAEYGWNTAVLWAQTILG